MSRERKAKYVLCLVMAWLAALFIFVLSGCQMGRGAVGDTKWLLQAAFDNMRPAEEDQQPAPRRQGMTTDDLFHRGK